MKIFIKYYFWVTNKFDYCKVYVHNVNTFSGFAKLSNTFWSMPDDKRQMIGAKPT